MQEGGKNYVRERGVSSGSEGGFLQIQGGLFLRIQNNKGLNNVKTRASSSKIRPQILEKTEKYSSKGASQREDQISLNFKFG